MNLRIKKVNVNARLTLNSLLSVFGRSKNVGSLCTKIIFFFFDIFQLTPYRKNTIHDHDTHTKKNRKNTL